MLCRSKSAPKRQHQTRSSSRKNAPQHRPSRSAHKITNHTYIKSAQSIFNASIGRSSMPRIPQDQAFPGIVLQPENLSDSSNDATNNTEQQPQNMFRFSNFGNKLPYVATTHTSKPVAKSTISVCINAGSRYETPAVQGLSHYFASTLIGSTRNRLLSSLVRDMGKLGTDLTSVASREHIILTASTPSQHIGPVLGALVDLLSSRIWKAPELPAQKASYMHNTLPFIESNNYIQLTELLHASAFGSVCLGAPLYGKTSSHFLGNVDEKALLSWRNALITTDRMTIAASNVNHSTFSQLSQEMAHRRLRTSNLQSIDHPTSSYMAKTQHIIAPDCIHAGSQNVLQNSALEQHVGIAWLASGLNHKDYLATLLLESMFSTGEIYGSQNSVQNSQQEIYGRPVTTHSPILRSVYDASANYRNRLFHNDKDQHVSAIIREVDSKYHAYSDSGLFSFHLVLPVNDQKLRDSTIASIVDTMTNYASNGISEEWFNTAKAKCQMRLAHIAANVHLSSIVTAHMLSIQQLAQIDRKHKESQRTNNGSETSPTQPGEQLKIVPSLSSHLERLKVDPIVVLQLELDNLTIQDVNRTLIAITQSPPTVVSRTSSFRGNF